ncbi:tRNA delta(2)-isopentenylpyrophosphate transferase [Ruegeria sp. ANG-R]|uniref:tRNA (adenosine(37)-N6)-dimethylallyltransferase MiaA n=1 Tax=Ruegeria sp. ANG-R TaxID=1577903 RepID=UPI00057F9085|nr:tRNA (adenosine(37)-N6)-dimethylallyltransferase MiaA [Ruegeria sp. ANG-R]KIC42524.1 tRNA delta(2)-isopentenylpyrophosphate transferase [Ruegeria sp. ANG-R]
MADNSANRLWEQLPPIPDDKPVLIAGPTASGKSALALLIAERCGGVIVNADASQVYDCWRIISARPSREEEARTPHRLYGHIAYDQTYSTGHWLRDITPLLSQNQRPIIVGGTGLYFTSLTEGMADIPPTPPDIRAKADMLPLQELIEGLDAQTLHRIDTQNRARVQRAWEVLSATGRTLADWQAETPAPILDIRNTVPIVFDAGKDWLLDRINRRFDQMLRQGAMDEVAAMRDLYDPSLPAFKAIGVPELMTCLEGRMTLDEARERATIATRQFAKRQRTWFRARMKSWHHIDAAS